MLLQSDSQELQHNLVWLDKSKSPWEKKKEEKNPALTNAWPELCYVDM